MKYRKFNKYFFYFKYNWILVILIILSIYDLRIDIRLLLDYFTFSTLLYTIFEHPLAISVLLTMPSFIKPLRKTWLNNIL